jgi:putative FmdB family regulatory protein
MPIYEYICKECEKRFEAIVNGGKKAHCPACDSTKLEQQFSAFAVGAAKGKGDFAKSAGSSSRKSPGGGCGSCGDPRGPGSCSMN